LPGSPMTAMRFTMWRYSGRRRRSPLFNAVADRSEIHLRLVFNQNAQKQPSIDGASSPYLRQPFLGQMRCCCP
jgi:hypothetical protein